MPDWLIGIEELIHQILFVSSLMRTTEATPVPSASEAAVIRNGLGKTHADPPPSVATSPTTKAVQLFRVANAAANTGASVETEPSNSPCCGEPSGLASAGNRSACRIRDRAQEGRGCDLRVR